MEYKKAKEEYNFDGICNHLLAMVRHGSIKELDDPMYPTYNTDTVLGAADVISAQEEEIARLEDVIVRIAALEVRCG